jgi:hypothetical protein
MEVINTTELLEDLGKEKELNEKLQERLQWIRDITGDYAEKPREGLQAIRIFLHDAASITKKHKERKRDERRN